MALLQCSSPIGKRHYDLLLNPAGYFRRGKFCPDCFARFQKNHACKMKCRLCGGKLDHESKMTKLGNLKKSLKLIKF